MAINFKVTDVEGKEKNLAVDLSAYKNAGANGRDLRQEVKYVAAAQGVQFDASKGDLLDQLYTKSGLLDSKYGGNAMTIKDLVGQDLNAAFRAPDGGDQSLGARLLFPQLILETLKENALHDDGSDIIQQWNSMIAVNRNLAGKRADQPIINTSGPEESRSQRITQLAEPATMIGITVSEKSYNIPTNSIGLLISDEAQEATTIDLVRTVMEAQARGDRIRRIREQLKAMVEGDEDLGIAALDVVQAKDFDSTIDANGVVTKKAWIKWLMHKQYTANLTRILSGVDEALIVDEALQSSKPGPDQTKIIAPYGGVDLGIPTPQFTLFEDTFGANTLVALDPRYAIQRFVNVSASYDGIEEYVMRKATGFRVDFGEMATRLYDEAWSVLSLTKG